MQIRNFISIAIVGGLCYGLTFDLHVKDVMTANEFSNAGLEKLSSDELGHLDRWVSKYSEGLVRKSSPVRRQADGLSAVESQIEGDFEGWSGETIFKLANGQIWQQATYAYFYHYAYRPKVMIFKSDSCYKMRVEGIDKTICVRRLK